MKFLADENFPGPSVFYLRKREIDISWIAEISPGVSDVDVVNLSNDQKRTILTHDSDYGELIFRHNIRPASGSYFLDSQIFYLSNLAKFSLILLRILALSPEN